MSLRTIKDAKPIEQRRAEEEELRRVVAEIIAGIRARGDVAVREYSSRFDRWSPASFRLSESDQQALLRRIPDTVLADVRFAQRQVQGFARAQRETLQDLEVETLPGVRLGHRHIPISDVGAYVPGGRFPMVASAHMSVLTAKVAGVPRVAAATPPYEGGIPAVTAAAIHLAGADEVYILGGVQAVAAFGIGTETIDRVDMLVGPGNAYVAEAKRQLFGDVGLDLLAGPTEILVVADDMADPRLVAVDLLSQAEHGPNSPAVLISLSEPLALAVLREIELQLVSLPTAATASAAWRDYGQVHIVDSLADAVAKADDLAFEHVEIHTADPRYFLEHMHHYGALFLGEGTTVAYGDKVIGTNHILPTHGTARYTGGLWVGKFLKTVTYQECTPAASREIGEVSARLCRIENFEAHARACDVRVERYGAAKPARPFA